MQQELQGGFPSSHVSVFVSTFSSWGIWPAWPHWICLDLLPLWYTIITHCNRKPLCEKIFLPVLSPLHVTFSHKAMCTADHMQIPFNIFWIKKNASSVSQCVLAWFATCKAVGLAAGKLKEPCCIFASVSTDQWEWVCHNAYIQRSHHCAQTERIIKKSSTEKMQRTIITWQKAGGDSSEHNTNFKTKLLYSWQLEMLIISHRLHSAGQEKPSIWCWKLL